jgi:hypothetical protein
VPQFNRTIDSRATRLSLARTAAQLAILGGLAAAGWFCLAPRLPAQELGSRTKAAAKSESSAPSDEDINRWIRELSHDSYAVRQEAVARLLATGTPARRALLEIVDGPDPETRTAARRLVSLIDRSEFQRKLEAFAADGDGNQKHSLPGWEQFQKLVGGDSAARALFVDMQRQEGAILSAVFGVSKHPPEELWEARLQRVTQWRAMASERGAAPPLGSCVAMLFLGSVSEVTVSDTAAQLTQSIVESAQIREAMQNEKTQEPVRKLVVGWLLNCSNKNENVLRQRLTMISANGLVQALPLALAIVGGDPQYLHVQPLARAEAALIVGQLGKREHIDRLEPLLEDTTVCLQSPTPVPGQPAHTVQVRDVALVVMLQLTQQNAADYGYLNARLQPTRTFQMQTLFRDSDEERAKAIAKWREWWALHKGDKVAGPNANAKIVPEKPTASDAEPSQLPDRTTRE